MFLKFYFVTMLVILRKYITLSLQEILHIRHCHLKSTPWSYAAVGPVHTDHPPSSTSVQDFRVTRSSAGRTSVRCTVVPAEERPELRMRTEGRQQPAWSRVAGTETDSRETRLQPVGVRATCTAVTALI